MTYNAKTKMNFYKLTVWLLTVAMLMNFMTTFSFAASETDTESTLFSNGSVFEATRTDFRDESVYSLIITRFYDGDSGNNVHCWDDNYAGNPDSDPAWRGDFKGLVEKLEYIKALGFTAVRLNPVAQNASGYDYYGKHPINLKEIDYRYESDGYTYEDLVNACHSKGLKVMQEVVLNSTSNFGEEFLRKLFEVNEDEDWSDLTKALTPTDLLLEQYPNYLQLGPGEQFQARLDMLKAHVTSTLNADEHYHREKRMGYENSLEQQGSKAGDEVDINTENPEVALYLAESCYEYAQMGVDAIMILDARYINRWTFNEGILPLLQKMLEDDGLELEIFYEVEARARETWNHNIPSSSVPFYSWAETEEAWIGNWDNASPSANIQKSIEHYDAHSNPANSPTSTNAFLDGLTYHEPDYSQSSGMNGYDFTMLWNFETASHAFVAAKSEDQYFNDSTWNLMSMDTWNYGPDGMEKYKLVSDTTQLKENLSLMFTFRGIPGITAGTEIEFQKGMIIDPGANAPLSTTARAYYGDNLEGEIETTSFGMYNASGPVATTLSSELSQHMQMLNKARQLVPALRKGQYTVDSNYVSGDMAFIRRYTDKAIDSLALVTISGGAEFTNIPNGKYIDVVSGNETEVTDGTLMVDDISKGELAVYVCGADGFTAPDTTFEIEKYTATFDANGGEGEIDDITSEFGYIALPECTFIPPEGKIFKSWSIGDEEYRAGSSIKTTENVTVKALWIDIVYCNISFDANGGGKTMADITVQGGDYTLPQCSFTAPFGKSFKAWSINNKTYMPGATVNVSADTKITAEWQDIVMTLTQIRITAEGLPIDAKLILAGYTEQEMIDVKSFDITDSVWSRTYVEAGLDRANAKMIKAFLWNDMEALVPLCVDSSIALNDTTDNNDVIYFNNTAGWSTVNAYCWSNTGNIASWPGKGMTNIAGTDIWYIEGTKDMQYVIFNNGSMQTGDIVIPVDGNNLYNYDTGYWSTYN